MIVSLGCDWWFLVMWLMWCLRTLFNSFFFFIFITFSLLLRRLRQIFNLVGYLYILTISIDSENGGDTKEKRFHNIFHRRKEIKTSKTLPK